MVQSVQDHLKSSADFLCVLSRGRFPDLSRSSEGLTPREDQASLFRQLAQVGTPTPVSSMATVLPKPLMPGQTPSPLPSVSAGVPDSLWKPPDT